MSKVTVQNNEKTTKKPGGCTGKGFKRGESGNPGGRPKMKILTEAYKKFLAEVVPDDPKGRTYAEAIAEAVIREAMNGKTQAAIEIADRVEGRVTTKVDVESNVMDTLAERMAEARKRVMDSYSSHQTNFTRGGSMNSTCPSRVER